MHRGDLSARKSSLSRNSSILRKRGFAMTPNDSDSNRSRIDSSVQSPATERVLSNQDASVSRREFLGMAAASLVVAGGSVVQQSRIARTEFPIEPWDAPAKRFRSSDSAVITWASRAIPTKAFASFALASTKESIFSITAGTTTTEKAKFEWAERCAMVIARKPS